jgi:energy-coupling factor transport system permease protein
VILLSFLIFLPTAWPSYILVTLFCLGAVAVSRVPLIMILRGLRFILIFLAIGTVFNAFFTPGTPLITLGSWVITKEGLILSLISSVRLILLVTTASLLTLTTSPLQLTDGLERLLRPLARLGVPAHELALMMTIALRFIPTLMDEADRIMRAQASRGADFQSGNLVARVRALIPVMVPLFVAAFRRADELAIAMEARGYRGGKGRTKMKELSMTSADVVAMAVLILFATMLGYLRWGGRT